MIECILLVLAIAVALHFLNEVLLTCSYANKKTRKTINKIAKQILKSL